MYIPEHKFIVESVGDIKTTNNNQHHFQKILLRKPAWRDELGDPVGQDDLFEVSVWNKTIEEIPVLKKGDKVKALLNLSGREFVDKNSSGIFYNLQLNIKKLELL